LKRLKKRKNCTMGDLWKCLNLGLPDTPAVVTEMAPSERMTRRMLTELAEAGRDWPALAEYARSRGWLTEKLGAPRIGEVREYTVQSNRKQLYIRVRVDPLLVTRGQTLHVKFNSGNIVIRAS
jgi:hypothetical protein